MELANMAASAPGLKAGALVSLAHACATEIESRLGAVLMRRLTDRQVDAFRQALTRSHDDAVTWLQETVPERMSIINGVTREGLGDVAERFGGSAPTVVQADLLTARAAGGA